MISMQKSSDQMIMSLEEKRMKMEERQMKLDVQMRPGGEAVSDADNADVDAAKHRSLYATTNAKLSYAFHI